MDPLSVTAGVTGLFALTIQLIAAVESIVQTVKTQPAVLQNIIRELTALHLVLERLEKSVVSGRTPYPEDEALISVLNGCKGTYHNIGRELATIQAKLKKNPMSKLYTQMTFTSRMKNMDVLRDQLEKYKATLIIALHLRTLETPPDDLRKEISDLRVELNVFNSRPISHQSRLGAIQQYLMTTSNLVERKDFGGGNISRPESPQTRKSNQDLQSLRTMSSTTLVPQSSASSDSQSIRSQEGDLETFQSFQNWLGKFAPSGEQPDKPDIEANLAALRLANTELQDKAKTSSPQNFVSPETSPIKTSMLSSAPGKILLTVTNLRKRGHSAPKTEEIPINTDAQIYELIEILYGRGYVDICGFKIDESTTVGPITAFDSAWPVVVTSGPSNYSLTHGLRINQDESLAEFYDNILTTDKLAHKPRPTFSINRKIHGLVIEDYWVSRTVEKVRGLTITFDRTLRVPEDGQAYHLPAILGTLPVLTSDHFRHRLPAVMAQKGGILLPMFQREALVISFRSNDGEEHGQAADYAIKVFAGSVNAISGRLALHAGTKPEQDYIVAPSQQRLDGFCSEKGLVRQFVAMPIGFNYTAESQLTGDEFIGGVQLQIAPRFKGTGHFSLNGHQKEFGPLKQMDISTPDSLNRFQTPRQLGLHPGRRIFVEGYEITELSKSLLVDERHMKNLTDKRLFSRCENKCRSAFVHELYTRARDRLPSLPTALKLVPIRPLSITVELGVAKRERFENLDAPVTSAVQYYSQFLDVVDFKQQLFKEHEEASRYIYFNDVTHDESPTYYDPIENYDLDGGVISFSAGWMSARADGKASDDIISPERVIPGTWEMGLAVGGGIHQEIREDTNPQQWNWRKSELVNVQILNSVIFESVTGIKSPPCPISVQDYIQGRMPFYHIIQDSPIEGSAVLKGIRSVGQLDSSIEIPIGVSMRKDSGPSGCAVCQKSLCDSIIQPCQHMFCYNCVQAYMTKNIHTTCAACLQVATDLVEFSAPMELPFSGVISTSDVEKENPVGDESQSPDPIQPIKSIDIGAFKVLAESLGLSSRSPEYYKFLELVQSFQGGRSALQEAAQIGRAREVQRLLAGESFVDEVPAEKGGRTALQAAAENGHLSIVRMLLDSGASANEDPAPENGFTSLQAASAAGHIGVVRMLIAAGADVNASPCRLNGRTSLQAASSAGHLEIIQQLVQNGADVGALCCQSPAQIAEHENCPGLTALHFAAENGNEKVLQFLLETSSLQNLTVSLDSVLLAAARNGHFTVAKLLLAQGANPQAEGKAKTTPLHEAAKGGCKDLVILLLKNGADINARCEGQETPLFLASRSGREDVVRLLLSKFSTFKPWDDSRQASMTYVRLKKHFEPALHLSAERGDEPAVRLLLKLGFDPDGNTKGIEETPLFRAAEHGHTAIIELLLENGADIYGTESVRNGYSITPLHLAAEGGHVKTVQLLLSRGLSHKSPYDIRYEALHAAARAGKEAIVRILIEAGANPSAPSRWHGTPLHQAAAGGSESVLRLLLDHGVDPMARDHLKSTPLHGAGRHPAILQILLDLGADPNTRGWDNEVTLHHAVKQGCLASVQLLLARGADPHAQDRFRGTLFHHLVPEKHFWSTSGREQQVVFPPAEAEERRSIALILLEQGVDINALGGSSNDTALAQAVKNGNLTMTRILLELGVHVILPPSGLLSTASQGLPDIAQLLLEKGMNPNIASNNGRTPLHAAAENGCATVMRLLVEYGAYVDIREGARDPTSGRKTAENAIYYEASGNTPLHIAAARGHYAAVSALLDLGADANLNSRRGDTALHLAAANKHSRVVWRLIEHGADGTIPNEKGMSVFQMAAESRYSAAVVGVLRQNQRVRL